MSKVLRRAIALLLAAGILIAVGYAAMSRCRSDSLSLLSQANADNWTKAPLRAYATFRLDASPDEVFAYLSSEQALPRWMPGLENLRYDHTNSKTVGQLSEGSTRTMTFGNQSELEEIVYFNRPNAISYQIVEGVPVVNHLAVMSLETDGKGNSILIWEQFFDIKRSSFYGWLMPFMVRRFMSSGEANLIDTFGGESVAACQSRLS